VFFDYGGPSDGATDVCSVPMGYNSPPDVIEVEGVNGVCHYYQAYAKRYIERKAFYRYIGTKRPDNLVAQ
jgi:hypothetical protein